MTDQVDVHVMVGRRCVAGTLDNRNQRVLDVLNEPDSEFLRLRRVSGGDLTSGTYLPQCDDAVVPKSMIDAVVLLGDRHEAPVRRKNLLVNKRAYPVLVVLNEYEIRGVLMLSVRPDPILTFGSQAPTFFPIVGAEFSGRTDIPARFAGSVALVNKSNVLLMQIDDRAVARPSGD